MFGFPSSIHASPSVAEERKEPKVASTNPSPNEKEQKQQAQDDKKATIKKIRQKAKKPLVRPPQFESSSSSKSLTCTIEEAHTGEVDNSPLPVMNGMVLPEVDMNALPQDQYFTFHFEDNESENENEKENGSNMKEIQSSNVQSTTVPRMKVDNSTLPVMNGTTVSRMTGSVLPAVAPNPSPYPRPSIPLPNAPVMPTSVLPANQPSFHTPSVSPPSPSLSSANPTPLQPHTTQSDSLLQSTMSILDIPYPHVADQPELIESLPSEAPPMNTGVRFPDPPVINSVQQTPGVTLPGPISFKPSTTTLQGNLVPTRDDLYVPISSCENGISW